VLGEVKVLSQASGGGGSTSGNINWLVTDQLGTPRMVFDQTGSLATMKRHDYLPFGEELFANQGLRDQGYVADNVRQKFTRKERDNETGLDYFLARYYSSTQGRFTSPDPIFISEKKIAAPQSWNLYNYVNNNPLTYLDPTGIERELNPGTSSSVPNFSTYSITSTSPIRSVTSTPPLWIKTLEKFLIPAISATSHQPATIPG
jgi:RHS repeat-associated protein